MLWWHDRGGYAIDIGTLKAQENYTDTSGIWPKGKPFYYERL